MMRFTYCVIAALLAGAPARADLLFQGTHHKYRQQIQRVYRSLPGRGKAVDVRVVELPASEWTLVDDSTDTQGAIVGVYFPGRRRLYLKSYPDLPYVFAHEYGHSVWFESFTDAERADWLVWWQEHQDLMPRPYARTNEAEGFAECFAATYAASYGQGFGSAGDAVRAKIQSYF